MIDKAAQIIKEASNIIITSGAGMGMVTIIFSINVKMLRY